eukprot:gene19707-biopygen13779
MHPYQHLRDVRASTHNPLPVSLRGSETCSNASPSVHNKKLRRALPIHCGCSCMGRAAVVAANWAPALAYKDTGARCSSLHNLLGWTEFGVDRSDDALDKRGQGIAKRLTMAPEADGGGPSPLRWLIVEEVGALSPSTFQQLERELRQYCGDGFPGSRDARRREYSFAGLNVILVGDFYQMDPVTSAGQFFWHEDPTPVNRIGIDLLKREFGGESFVELRQQCRVLDIEYEHEVLRPLRDECRDRAEGPSREAAVCKKCDLHPPSCLHLPPPPHPKYI